MHRSILLTLLILAPALGLAGCDDPSEPAAEERGTVAMVLDVSTAGLAGYDITAVHVDFSHRESEAVVTADEPVTGDSAVVEADLRPGQWDIVVTLYEGELVVGEGATVALVEPGFVTAVDLEIEIVTGGIRVTVTWPEEIGLVADLSDRPVALNIAGVGTYDAHGLSRIGWNIDVLETSTGSGLTHKRPGRVRRPDVVMLDLTSTGEAEARALATWIADLRDPRSVAIELRGAAGEVVQLVLHQAVPVGGDTAITELGDNVFNLAGLRFAWESLQLVGYTPPTAAILPPCPRPGYFVDIEGIAISSSLCYGNDDVALPQPATSDPLPLPNLRDAEPLFTWAEAVRDDAEAYGCVGCQTAVRRSAAITFIDASANFAGQTNVYETWPARFTLFDPTGDYGYDLLMSTVLVSNRVENGA